MAALKLLDAGYGAAIPSETDKTSLESYLEGDAVSSKLVLAAAQDGIDYARSNGYQEDLVLAKAFGRPREALLSIAEQLEQLPFTNAANQRAIDALIRHVLRKAAKFARESNATPIDISVCIGDQKPKFRWEKGRTDVEWIDGTSAIAESPARVVINRTINGQTMTSNTDVVKKRADQITGVKFRLQCQTPTEEELDGMLSEAQRVCVAVGETMGGSVSAGELGALVKSMENSTQFPQELHALLTNMIQLQSLADAPAGQQPLQKIGEITNTIKEILAQGVAEQTISPAMAKAAIESVNNIAQDFNVADAMPLADFKPVEIQAKAMEIAQDIQGAIKTLDPVSDAGKIEQLTVIAESLSQTEPKEMAAALKSLPEIIGQDLAQTSPQPGVEKIIESAKNLQDIVVSDKPSLQAAVVVESAHKADAPAPKETTSAATVTIAEAPAVQAASGKAASPEAPVTTASAPTAPTIVDTTKSATTAAPATTDVKDVPAIAQPAPAQDRTTVSIDASNANTPAKTETVTHTTNTITAEQAAPAAAKISEVAQKAPEVNGAKEIPVTTPTAQNYEQAIGAQPANANTPAKAEIVAPAAHTMTGEQQGLAVSASKPAEASSKAQEASVVKEIPATAPAAQNFDRAMGAEPANTNTAAKPSAVTTANADAVVSSAAPSAPQTARAPDVKIDTGTTPPLVASSSLSQQFVAEAPRIATPAASEPASTRASVTPGVAEPQPLRAPEGMAATVPSVSTPPAANMSAPSSPPPPVTNATPAAQPQTSAPPARMDAPQTNGPVNTPPPAPIVQNATPPQNSAPAPVAPPAPPAPAAVPTAAVPPPVPTPPPVTPAKMDAPAIQPQTTGPVSSPPPAPVVTPNIQGAFAVSGTGQPVTTAPIVTPTAAATSVTNQPAANDVVYAPKDPAKVQAGLEQLATAHPQIAPQIQAIQETLRASGTVDHEKINAVVTRVGHDAASVATRELGAPVGTEGVPAPEARRPEETREREITREEPEAREPKRDPFADQPKPETPHEPTGGGGGGGPNLQDKDADGNDPCRKCDKTKGCCKPFEEATNPEALAKAKEEGTQIKVKGITVRKKSEPAPEAAMS